MTAALAALALAAAAGPRTAVMDVHLGAGVEGSLGAYLTQVLASEVAERSGAQPVVSADLTAMLGLEKQRELLGCEGSDACAAEIAGALGADRIVSASVAAAGANYLVTASLLDGAHARPIARATRMCAKDNAAVEVALRAVAAQLYAAPPAPEAKSAPLARGTWAALAGGVAAALVGGGAWAGTTAMSEAQANDADAALLRAHLADGLYAGALVALGAAGFLWFTRPAP